MSLESQVAALVTATNTLTAQVVGGKIEEINDVLNQAIIDLPANMEKAFYVDQVNGLDTHNGLTLTTPFKTVKKAVDSSPEQGFCTIIILGNEGEDYTWQLIDKRIAVRSALNILPMTRSGGSRQGGLVFPWRANTDDEYNIDAFGFTERSNQNICIRNFDIKIPAQPSGVTFEDSDYIGIFSGNRSGKRSLQQFNFAGCNFNNLSTIGKLCSTSFHCVALTVSFTTHTGMAGKWVNGIASGTAPKDTGRVLSNLATL